MVSGLITTSSVKQWQRHSVACGGVPCVGWVIAGRGGCHAALWPFCGSHAIRSGFRVDGSGIVSAGCCLIVGFIRLAVWYYLCVIAYILFLFVVNIIFYGYSGWNANVIK